MVLLVRFQFANLRKIDENLQDSSKMLGAGMVKFYVPIYMFMMNHSGIVSVIKKSVPASHEEGTL